jgi:hypothetical protein
MHLTFLPCINQFDVLSNGLLVKDSQDIRSAWQEFLVRLGFAGEVQGLGHG